MLRNSSVVLVVGLLALLATLSGWLTPLEHTLVDLRFRLMERAPTGDVVLVDIDAKSIAAEGRWPWPRTIHADLVDRLVDLGASDIAFDVDFSARSNPEDDAAFAAALERAGGNVILAAFDQKGTATPGDTSVVHNRPIPSLAAHAWIAGLNVKPDSDGAVRRLTFAERSKGETLPSLAAMIGGGSGALNQDFRVDFSIDARKINRISVVDVIEGRVARSRIAGKKVIVGANALELRDFFEVPVYRSVSGSMLQALGAESIAQGRALSGTSDLFAISGILAISLLYLAGLRPRRWTYSLLFLSCLSLAIEAAALLVQQKWAIVPDTAAWQASLWALGLVTLLREIDFRHILILIARNRSENTQTILDRVVADNFAGIIVADENRIVRAASQAAGEILENGPDLVGRKVQDLLPPELVWAIDDTFQRARGGGALDGALHELEYRRRDGQAAVLEYVVTPSRLAGGFTHEGEQLPDSVVASLTFIDVTDKRQAAARIAYLAQFDTLTGLSNRNRFIESLAVALRRKLQTRESCAVICFELDRFKNVNASLGHDIGDLLLQAVAQRARALLAPDDLIARLGSDEFAVMCPGGDARARAMAFAENLIANVGKPYDLSGHRQIIGVSFGLALAEDGESDPLIVLKHADAALHAAKSEGGNTISFFEPGMTAGLRERRALELDLWEAFDRDEFEIYYQPQIDLASGRLCGLEALLRWRHPEHGFVSPAEFIPIAEASGLIQQLGAWVLEKACIAAADLPQPVKLAVNVSAVQFARGDVKRAVADALARSGLPARRLELEITESLLLQQSQLVRDTLQHLRDIGVGFALDDFGTGYSSLNYIHKFPISKIKIDRSFIAEIPLSQDSAAIVSAVAALARSLDIRLTAEGIETREQLELLRLLGCDEGQGYLFGRPEPLETILQKMATEGSFMPSRQASSA